MAGSSPHPSPPRPSRARTGALLALLALVVALLGAACAPERPPPVAPDEVDLGRAPVAVAGSEGSAGDAGDLGPIPVTAADPTWGSPDAPVTIVQFAEFECPFCKRAAGTVAKLQDEYGPERLRVVWKHNPLAFHKHARTAAEVSTAIFASGGSRAFWTFHDAVFAEDGRLDAAAIERAASRAGFSQDDLEDMVERPLVRAKLDADMALAASRGATGTPAFFINGVDLRGAQPIERFRPIIDDELRRAKELVAAGMPASRVYAYRVGQNLAANEAEEHEDEEDDGPSAAQRAADEAAEAAIVHRVPVAGSPALGPANALVTVVVFSDFQCPFCARVEPTLAQLRTEYGPRLRVVWKDHALPFHTRAGPAAELAREARAQKGDAGFWLAHDALFASQRNLEDADLRRIAKAIGLDADRAMRAVEARKHAATLDEDADLAEELGARGTPAFFINGKKLSGAQPVEKFRAVIDAELARASQLVANGTPAAAVYDAIQKSAVGPEAPKLVTVPAPTKASPSKGPPNAKVVVHVFSEFECPFCARVEPTLAELDAAFPGQIRFVWHNFPLTFHKNAMPAAEAAMEAFRQKGDAGFWKMHDLLFEDQRAGLERPALEEHARKLGLDLARFTAALDAGTHRAAIEADLKIAEAAGVSGTPAFVIQGQFLSGAQPLAKFKKLVRAALAKKTQAVARP